MRDAELELEAELESLMAVLSESELEWEAEWEGESIPKGRCTPTGKRVGSFTCSPADQNAIQELLQMSIPIATLRSAVETAAGASVALIGITAATLDRPKRTAASRAAFCASFGVQPEFVPEWRGSLRGAVKWRDLGELVAIRLRDAAKIIDGGCIKYFALGSVAHCPECTGTPDGYISCSSFRGHYTICLGNPFWQAWQSGDTVTTDLNLLHEALHIYFGTTVAHEGRTGNASCYQAYVARINGLPLPKRFTDACPVGAC
jgi:hypothetical protein